MGNYSTIQQFGDYQFPDTVSDWKDNFKSLRTLGMELPGRSGTIDQYGTGFSPTKDGKVSLTFWLISDTEDGMQTKKDELYSMAGFGKQRLWLKPYNPVLPRRWCNARIESIDIDENAENCSWRNQMVRMTFQVTEACWNSIVEGDNSSIWGDPASIWGGDGVIWGGSPGSPYTAPTSLDITINYKGTSQVPILVNINCGVGQSIQQPKIQRLKNLIPVEEVEYIGTINAGEVLSIDARKLSVKKSGISVYNNVEITRASWLTLIPGNNIIRLTSTGPVDEGTMKITYRERYY